MQTVEDTLYELTSEFVSDTGFKLVDVREVTEHGRRVFKFCIDHAQGITVADCRLVSRELAYFLDAEGEVDGAYVLEVTSPGLDRDLVKEREYEHFAGRKVRLVLRGGGADGVMMGTIVSAQGGKLTLKPDGVEEVEIPLSRIARARLEIEMP